jgi:hypothetical protein
MSDTDPVDVHRALQKAARELAHAADHGSEAQYLNAIDRLEEKLQAVRSLTRQEVTMQASDDPVLRAATAIGAAIESLRVARELLPDDHPAAQKLTTLTNQARSVERDVRTVWVDDHGDGKWRAVSIDGRRVIL